MHAKHLYIPAPDPELPPARISQADARAITGRSRRTIQRWIRQGRVLDPAALAALQRYAFGILPPPWESWRICPHTGALVDPDGRTHSQADIRGAHINAQLVAALRGRVSALEEQRAALAREIQEKPLERLQRAARALAGR